MFHRVNDFRIGLLAVTLAIWGGLQSAQPGAAAGNDGDERGVVPIRYQRSGEKDIATARQYVSVLAKDASNASLSITSPSVNEGDSGTTEVNFTISLSHSVGYEAWFAYRTGDGSATSGGPAPDYLAASGMGSIPAGQTSASVTISVLGDTADEPDETFVLELTSADVPIAGSVGVCTIEDDDPTPSLLEPVGEDAPTCQLGGTEDLTVELSDENRQPLPGIVVDWTTDGGATFPPDGSRQRSSTTQADGTTSVTVTCPAEAGESRVEARVAGLETQVFTLIGGDFITDLMSLDPVAAAVGEALNVICPRNDLDADLQNTCEAVAGLQADELNAALRQIASEEAAAQGTALAEALRIQQRNLGARLMDLHTVVVTVDRGDDRLGFFLKGILGMGDRPDTTLENGFDLETRVLTAGIDYRLLPTTLPGNRLYVGGALSYYLTKMDLVGGGGGLETRGAGLSAYATYVNDEHAYHLDGIVTYGRGELDFKRRIDFSGISPQVARGTPGSDQLALSFGGGRTWETGRRRKSGGMTIRGLGRVDYLKAVVDSYAEQGAPGFNLVLDEQEVSSLLASAGVQISYTKTLRGPSFIEPMIRLDVLHEFADDSRPIKARFVDDPGDTSFIIRTDEPDRDYLNLKLGVSVQLQPGRRAYLFYAEDLERRDLSFYSLSAGVRIEF